MRFELAPFDLPASYADGIVSLADIKEHLVVEDDDRNDLIGLLRDAAVDMVERYCGVRLGACTGLEFHAEELCSPIELGVWPVTGLTSIAYLDGDGTDQAATIGDWRIVMRDRIALKPSKSLPSDVSAGVVITFDAGFTDDNRPAALVQAVKLFTAHLFANREAVAVAGSVGGEIPLGFRQLCSAYRLPRI